MLFTIPIPVVHCAVNIFMIMVNVIMYLFVCRFIGNTITVRRSDGTLIQNYVPPFVSALYQLVRDGQWDQAIRICRTIKEDYLWAILAGMAVNQRVYNIAETCYVQLKEISC